MTWTCVYIVNRPKGESQMKKRVVALLLALLFSITGMLAENGKVYAEDAGQDVELSEIWTEDAIVGYAQSETWGLYL